MFANSFSKTSEAARWLVVLSLLLRSTPTLYGESPSSPEYLIKAAFIYNFSMFVEWPEDAFELPDSPMVIGIVGQDPFGSAIDRAVEDKKIRGRHIVVKRLPWNQQMKECHLLFVASSEAARMGQLDHLVGGRPVLTIGETPAFAREGGIISFVLEEKKVRFEINTEAAKHANLNLSSKLLSLARIVR